MALLSDIDNYDNNEDAVVLMTIHSSKGLEFDHVFMAGLEEGIFPSQRSSLTMDDLEEERRLMYVAVTRARKELYITATVQRTLFGMTGFSRLSRFMEEIPPEYIEKELPQRKASPIAERPSYNNPYMRKPSMAAAPSTVIKKAPVPEVEEGDRVSHIKFGKGTVLSAVKLGGDMKVEIEFDDFGKKTLMASFAKLTKI